MRREKMEDFTNQDIVVLAEQTNRTIEQTRKPRNRYT